LAEILKVAISIEYAEVIISIYLDSFLQVEEQRIYCLALGEMVELEEWIHGEGNIFSTTNVNHISNIFVIKMLRDYSLLCQVNWLGLGSTGSASN
jgi:hypothetical protein